MQTKEALFLTAFAATFSMGAILAIKNPMLPCLLTFAYLILMMSPLILLIFMFSLSNRTLASIKSRINHYDINAIINFMDYRISPKLQLEIVARYKLLEMLPKVTSLEANKIDVAQRQKLYRHLTDDNASVVLAILNFIRLTGDTKAINYVRYLSAGKGTADENRNIRALSQECLIILQANIERSTSPKILLRASQRPDLDETTLLRAATSSNPTSPDQLLRPSSTKPPA